MGLFLFRFWPVLVPLIIYWLWHRSVHAHAVRKGETPPHFRDGPWYWAVLASLITAFVCFIWLGATQESEKGHYIPPHMENGVLVPGKVEP